MCVPFGRAGRREPLTTRLIVAIQLHWRTIRFRPLDSMGGPIIRCAHACLGATLMQCLGCGAKMLLMEVVRDNTTKVSAFERHIFKCSACPQIARRFVFSRVKMPVSHLPVITTPTRNLWKGCVAAPSAWGKAVETLRSRQTDLKERTAAAKTATWTKAVEKLRSKQTALGEQAAVGSRPKLAEPVPAPAASSAPSASPTTPSEPIAPPSTWERAVAKVRARQDICEG